MDEVIDASRECWPFLVLCTAGGEAREGTAERVSTGRITAAFIKALRTLVLERLEVCEHELQVDVVTLYEEAAAPPPLERVATRATGCRVILKPSAWSARDDARRPVVMENVGLSQAVALRARALLGPEDAERFDLAAYAHGTRLLPWTGAFLGDEPDGQRMMVCDRLACTRPVVTAEDALVHPRLHDAGGLVIASEIRATRPRRPPDRLDPSCILRRRQVYSFGSSPEDLAGWAPQWLRNATRPGLTTKRTTICGPSGKPLREWGLFTDRQVESGALLALIHGEVTTALSTWAMAVDDGILVGPKPQDLAHPGRLRRWLAEHPWARVNEPPLGSTANAVVIAWHKAAEVVAHAPASHRVLCWAVHAAVELDAGQEILMHYSPLASDDYAPLRRLRDYQVGAPAAKLRRADIGQDESPAAIFGCHTLSSAIF